MAETETQDRRVLRSRQALTEAFLALVVEGPYDDIKVGDIAERAGVGRSTFYEHYANKDELLRASLAPAFEALADMCTDRHDHEALASWMGAFWDNRRVGRAMLGGQALIYLVRQLAALIEERLAKTRRGGPIRLLAYHMAEAQLGLVLAWQSGVAASPPADLARLLHRTACAMAQAGQAGMD